MKVHIAASYIWPILSLAAKNRQVITYGVLNKLIGYGSNHLGQCLEPIQSYCLLNNIPALSVIVVNKSNEPGSGFIAEKNIREGQEKVFAHDWINESTPCAGELQTAVSELKTCGRPQSLQDVKVLNNETNQTRLINANTFV